MNCKGVQFEMLNKLTVSNQNVPTVAPSSNHKVLVKLPLQNNHEIQPYPPTYEDIWDEAHVRMPNSPHNQIPQKKPNEEPSMIERWKVISSALQEPIKTAEELRKAVLKYNPDRHWTFIGLKSMLQDDMSSKEREFFFKTTLPGIIKLALSLPELVTTPLPYLLKETNVSITLSQKQVASLLANAFLCTFPQRSPKAKDPCGLPLFPSINFDNLLNKDFPLIVAEKLKCIFQYFKEMVLHGREGLLTFSRQTASSEDQPDFEASTKPLSRLHITSKGCIEEATGLLQLDFADKYIGGFVLSIGCVQEEIRFLLCPELIISRLFTECLHERDSLIITGVEQFNRGKGYGSSFKWAGPYKDSTPRDNFRRRLCQVVAVDAYHFDETRVEQYEPTFIRRELIKAFAGFYVSESSPGAHVAIATGNWGCGIFNGDPLLKSLIQLTSAAQSERDVAYFTFNDKVLCQKIYKMYEFLYSRGINTGQLVTALLNYFEKAKVNGSSLFQYLEEEFSPLPILDDHMDSSGSGTSFLANFICCVK